MQIYVPLPSYTHAYQYLVLLTCYTRLLMYEKGSLQKSKFGLQLDKFKISSLSAERNAVKSPSVK